VHLLGGKAETQKLLPFNEAVFSGTILTRIISVKRKRPKADRKIKSNSHMRPQTRLSLVKGKRQIRDQQLTTLSFQGAAHQFILTSDLGKVGVLISQVDITIFNCPSRIKGVVVSSLRQFIGIAGSLV
jgi:hypothetical protein